MVIINKGMLGLAAFVAFGLVILEDLARGRASAVPLVEHAASSINEDSAARVRALETLRALAAKEQANGAAGEHWTAPKCRMQSWPYYSHDCLVYSDGTAVLPAARVIRIDGRPDAAIRVARLQ